MAGSATQTFAAQTVVSGSQAASAEALLDVRGLRVRFPGQVAVDGLDLRVQAGQTVALVGESGCGKSTTALSIMRLLPQQARIDGRILLDGEDVLALSPKQLAAMRGNRVSMIFQEPMSSLNPLLSIGQQVAEAITLHQPLSAREARQRAIDLLDLVQLPAASRRFDDYPHHLSGGQRQRVMIAMAVACRPRLLIADEPTTALDVTVQAQILALIDSLRRELGMAVLLITHDLGVVAQWADRVAVMHGGRKLEEGDAARVFAAPASPYTRGLLGASLHFSRDDQTHDSNTRLPEIRLDAKGEFVLVRPTPRVAAGQNVSSAKPAAPVSPLLAVQDLHVHYASAHGNLHAVRGVSFDIAPGETLGLVGESGCGKSSLSRAIMRLTAAQRGSVTLAGQDLLALSARALLPWRKHMQMIFQDPYGSLNPRHRVDDILGYALEIHGVRDRAERTRRVSAILDDVGLPTTAARRYAHEFSGGQRQRIGIARALVLRPELVICDEPVSALDVSVQAQILNLLMDLKNVYGLSYLFISHDLAVVRYLADRVMVMHDGQIVEFGNRQTIWQAPQHAYTRSLIAAVPGAHDRGQRQGPGHASAQALAQPHLPTHAQPHAHAQPETQAGAGTRKWAA
ncbi:ABC transporter ATP-binding protein [Pigmentiphaga aceris]|uniref:ABC transporter ATP-binding protein n=1 Tax=Pigmentiphaga aceris TaxID=1940612 RepID=A0A5C0B0G9_9BURK|nr:ABC transporter ATP-binding protein [Pigmentiphaga aceris]QEI07374.1 ABC transporter ATP-binding protein [Pigmentiphaga aceris]